MLSIFRDQARLGGPLTLTDPNATRFWMKMDEACELVALAAREMRGGEVFLPKLQGTDMATFAEAVAPGVAWRIMGLGAGEKLHEALLSPDEARETYDYGDHLRIETTRTWEDGGMHATGEKVHDGYTYTSDADPMSAAQLRALVA